MKLLSLPALQDNYIWLLADEVSQHCIIIDPTIASPVLDELQDQNWQPEAILITHHHPDHLGGVAQLIQHYPQLPVYGPEEIHSIMHSANAHFQPVTPEYSLTLLNKEITIIATPGHTLDHLCYYTSPYLFCGDTLFSAGCGRLFEGTAEQMHKSLTRLTELPQATLICCAHEYTLNNLQFARSIMPDNLFLRDYTQKVEQLRENNQPSLPSRLDIELKINPFLRLFDNELQKNLLIDTKKYQSWQIFALLRKQKDNF